MGVAFCILFASLFDAKAQDSTQVVQLPDGVKIEMVWVEGGSFTMGSNTGVSHRHKYDANRPEHKVTVNSFFIGRTEVTQAQWKAVMGENPSHFNTGDSLPVEQVSWSDAQRFVTILSQMTGHRFRLPTEAEWEYAARGGKKSAKNPYAGCNRERLNEYAWYCVDSERQTHKVASLLPNELGLYDMSGNVAEWCHDWMAPYVASEQSDPRGPQDGDSRTLRGGHYNSTSAACTVYDRSWYEPAAANEYFGLRLVMETEKTMEEGE